MVKIKELRKAKGITQVELARACGVGQPSVVAWETGKNMPRANKLIIIAQLLDCGVDDLIKGDD